MKLPRVSIFENTRIDKLNIVLVVVLYSNLLDFVWRVVSSQRVFFFFARARWTGHACEAFNT